MFGPAALTGRRAAAGRQCSYLDIWPGGTHHEEVLERDVGLAVPSDSLERLCTRCGFSGVSVFSVTRAAIRDRHSSCGGDRHGQWSQSVVTQTHCHRHLNPHTPKIWFLSGFRPIYLGNVGKFKILLCEEKSY